MPEPIELDLGSNQTLIFTRRGTKIIGNVYEGDEDIAQISLTLPGARPYAFLHGFYASKKGVGKKMLCELMEYLLATAFVDETDEIKLQASGGSCTHKHHTTAEADLDQYLLQYPDLYSDLKHDARLLGHAEPTYEEKAHAVCASKANDKLIAYYNREYGFTVDAKFGMHADMTSTIGKLLTGCRTPAVRGGRSSKRRTSVR